MKETKEQASIAAVKISESVKPELTAKEQALFIAGFQECIKWLEQQSETPTQEAPAAVDGEEEAENKFIEKLGEELPNYGIDTSEWEYDHGDCCDSAVEFVARFMNQLKESAPPAAVIVEQDFANKNLETAVDVHNKFYGDAVENNRLQDERKRAKELFDKYFSFTDNAVAWSAWKRAFHLGIEEYKNQKAEVDGKEEGCPFDEQNCFNPKLKNMNTIPTKEENPKGLHQRYFVAKWIQGIDRSKYQLEDCILPVDVNAEYFVMRLDTGGSDLKHIEACRIGINAYADAIYPHLPELAIDLKNRYPLL